MARRGRPWMLPAVLVGLPTVFGLWMLRSELIAARFYNDAAMHFSMVRWASRRIADGHIPLDGWFPNLNLGVSWFHRYQSLPHLVTAYAGKVVGTGTAFRGAEYLLLALFPIAVFASTRLLGWDRVTAGAAALITPLLVSITSYGYEHSSYVWQGHGLWSQEWGMVLLPFAWALSWRAVGGRGSLALGAAAVGLTVAMHFLTGYLAVLSVVGFAVIVRRDIARRLGRAAAVAVGGLLIVAWVVVPLLVDSSTSNRTEFNQNTFWYDSFGARKVLGWLISGSLYDEGRLPVITVLVAVGLVVCLRRIRSDERARALVAVWLVSLLLFFGRPTLGPLLKLMPGTGDMQLHRYIMGVHLAGLLLGGVGAVWIGQRIHRLILGRETWGRGPGLAAATVVVIGLVVLYPAWSERLDYGRAGLHWVRVQRAADRADGADLNALVAEAKTRGPGRMYAGLPFNWGESYKVGLTPVYAQLTGADVDVVGFTLRTSSLSADPEVYFDETNPAAYNLFGVRYLMLPVDRRPAVPATALNRRGRHTLWEVGPVGYIDVVDTAGVIRANRSDIGRRIRPWLRSDEMRERVHPSIDFAGVDPAPPTLPAGATTTAPPGVVIQQLADPDRGSFVARVRADRAAMVLLKASYDPRWQVRVDGVAVKPQMVAPSFVGRIVPPGEHGVSFEYRPVASYPWLFLLGALTLGALVVVPRRWRVAEHDGVSVETRERPQSSTDTSPADARRDWP